MVLSVPPKSEITTTPATSERGMAIAEMKVVRRLPRKRKRMTTTRIPPSRRATETLWIATSMKSACRKFSFSIRHPAEVRCRSRGHGRCPVGESSPGLLHAEDLSG
jgi:hypothetical protein